MKTLFNGVPTSGMNRNTRPDRETSVLDLTNALLSEREIIPAARFQDQVENLNPQEWRLLQQQINACGLEIKCSTSTAANLLDCSAAQSR